jgi:ribose 5-phosphate isomerase A
MKRGIETTMRKKHITSEPPPLGLEWCRPILNREAKEIIAGAVARRASSGDVIGAGSGSTSFLTVLALGERVAAEKLDLTIVPTSLEIELACYAVGLNVHSAAPTHIDWCFDGADEVDPLGRMIKGRGGALYRERFVFTAADKRVVIADSSKTVDRLGRNFPVPVEVEPAWLRSAYARLSQLEHVSKVTLRMGVAKDGPVITESGRVMLDVAMTLIDETDEDLLLSVPGVCCTGIFSGFDFERVLE